MRTLRPSKLPRDLRFFALAGLTIFTFEFVAFSDFRGAKADDLDLFLVGGSSGGNTPPPNIVFLFDSSGSMNNIPCEELDGSLYCGSSGLRARSAPNTSTVCESPALAALMGPDVTGDGASDGYRYLFDRTSPNSYRGFGPYPVFDERGSSANDDIFPPWTTWDHSLHSPWDLLNTGSGSTTQAKLEDAIADECSGISDCYQRSRCIYSLRTQGYFWEKSSCASGDPMGMCFGCGEGTAWNGSFCDDNSDCESRRCVSGAACGAGTYANGSVCSTYTDCNSRYCAPATGCGQGAGAVGATCAADTDCDSRNCVTAATSGFAINAACTGNAQCASGYCPSCNIGAVANGGACSSNSQCVSRRCRSNGTCGNCTNNGQCTSGESCSGGLCRLPGCDKCQACTVGASGQCTSPKACFSGTCTTASCQSCSTNGECSGTDTCSSSKCRTAGCADKHCQGCTASSQCTGTDSCSSSKCRTTGCGSVSCQSCSVNSDCTAPDICNAGNCERPGCIRGLGSATGSSHSYVALGDFMNFYPPKGISLIKVFKDTIKNMAGDSRVGVADFDDVGKSSIAFAIKPPCSQATGTDCFDGDPSTECFPQNDSQLINYLENTLEFNDSTPLAKALDAVGKYYSGSTGANTPMCDYSTVSTCGDANNFVVIITDGFPNTDASSASGVPFVKSKIPTISDGYFNNNGYWLDDVAKALTRIDHRTDIANDQLVNTYAVSYGLLDSTDQSKCAGILEQTATAGGGRCIPARNSNELREALANIVTEIVKRARGFTSPSVATTRLKAAASLQNAMFRPTIHFPLWEGHVFANIACDENLGTGCTCSDSDATVCIQDANGNDISFDDEGNLLSTPLWDAALCLAGDAADALGSITQDKANTNVTQCYRTGAEGSTTPPSRVIYTAVEHGGASNTFTNDDVIPFTVASLTNGTYGTAFVTALDVGGVVADASKIVSFFRGLDSGDADGDGNSTEDRNLNTMRDGAGNLVDGWWKLGDIFHSIPNVVVAPDPNNDKGLLGGTRYDSESYQAFMADNATRPKVMLVGANDGMLHAFLLETWNSSRGEYYDSGRGGAEGQELWAFVSPEMLPKLKTLCDPGGGLCSLNTHKFLVDGSVEVRDIWMGGTADMDVAANKNKWKTVAIYGHRQGGHTYVALDVTDITAPRLLWQFPQANQTDLSGNAVSALMGESWLDVSPAPASIGPLWVDSDNNAATPGGYDRFVAMLSAGYDYLDSKGRALFMVDAWTGDIVWMAQKSGSGATATMNYSFPATPVFYMTADVNSYIQQIVAPDHGGQIWLISPSLTAPLVATSGRYSMNVEVMFKTNSTLIVTDSVGGDADGVLDANEYQRRPFFFNPTITQLPSGQVRIILATGDRDTLIPSSTRNATINGYLCTDQQRLYAMNVGACQGMSGSRPCLESDLADLDVPDAATDQSRGWFVRLTAGEKAATPFNIFAGYALYSTFLPTVACGGTSDSCSATIKGVARLHARHYISGKFYDWNGDNVSNASDILDLGEGVPTAPMVSVGVANGVATPTLFAGGSDSGVQATTASGLQLDSAEEIMRFPVSRSVHDCLHANTCQ